MAEEIQAAPAIIVMSHGPFCVGLIESAKMVYGEMTGVEALPLEEGMDPEVYERNFAELICRGRMNILWIKFEIFHRCMIY